jgi:hypothetical protein
VPQGTAESPVTRQRVVQLETSSHVVRPPEAKTWPHYYLFQQIYKCRALIGVPDLHVRLCAPFRTWCLQITSVEVLRHTLSPQHISKLMRRANSNARNIAKLKSRTHDYRHEPRVHAGCILVFPCLVHATGYPQKMIDPEGTRYIVPTTQPYMIPCYTRL